MSNVTLGTDFWSLAWPRLIQGIGRASSSYRCRPGPGLRVAYQLPTATAAFNVVRNVGGIIGLALATTLLSRRGQYHQSTLVGHIDVWDLHTTERLRDWTDHFAAQGSDPLTAGARRWRCSIATR